MNNTSEGELKKDEALEEKKPLRLRSLIFEILIYVIVILMAVFVIPKYVMGRVSVDGPSMENTLFDGDQLIGQQITSYTGNYERFDIIFFHPHGKSNDDVYIKRIIGLPGESVRIDEQGTIYINGQPLDESFGKEKMESPGRAADTIILAEDEYFVLGDNRNNSIDSRADSVGNVKKENIDGVAFFRIWPISEFGTLD